MGTLRFAHPTSLRIYGHAALCPSYEPGSRLCLYALGCGTGAPMVANFAMIGLTLSFRATPEFINKLVNTLPVTFKAIGAHHRLEKFKVLDDRIKLSG